MPKATLEFTLPEEQEEYELAVNGSRCDSALREFDNWLRSKLKYTTLTEEEYKLYEEVRTKLWECRHE